MDTPRGFSTNSLLNSLRSQFNLAKDNFSCEQIQDIMNIMGDLEHEITLLQTHYTLITKQSHHINDIRENVSELLEKMSANKIGYSEAMDLVFMANPDLSRDYQKWAGKISDLGNMTVH